MTPNARIVDALSDEIRPGALRHGNAPLDRAAVSNDSALPGPESGRRAQTSTGASTADEISNAFERDVAALIRSCGFVPVRSGWPDFAVFAKDGTLVAVIEAKAATDRVRPNQHLILQALAAARIETRIAHPWNQAAIVDWLFRLPGQTANPPSVSALVQGLGKFENYPPHYEEYELEPLSRYASKVTKRKKIRPPAEEIPEPIRGCHPYLRAELHRAMTRTCLVRGRLIAKAAAL